MNEEPQSITQQLYQTLLNQNQVLAEIIAQQQILHAAVTGKNWEQVERTVGAVQSLSQRFSALEQERVDVFVRVCPDNPGDIYEVSRRLPPVFKRPVIEAFHQVRQKLAVSKIENDVLNEYIRITQNFLQGVFESVLPQRRNMRYSPEGTVVKMQPQSVVVDTVI